MKKQNIILSILIVFFLIANILLTYRITIYQKMLRQDRDYSVLERINEIEKKLEEK